MDNLNTHLQQHQYEAARRQEEARRYRQAREVQEAERARRRR